MADDHIKTATCGALILEPTMAEESKLRRIILRCHGQFKTTGSTNVRVVLRRHTKLGIFILKCNDKVEGSSTEYQTQVKVKKVVYPPQPQAPSKSSGKRIKYY